MGGGDRSTTGGTYTLLLELERAASVEFGALGERDLEPGWYAYTGSALGPGGFARVERHRELAAGERDVRHWHVDSLLGHEHARLHDDVRTPGLEAECEVAGAIAAADGLDPVAGVGASDCECASHLAYATDASLLAAVVSTAHERAAD